VLNKTALVTLAHAWVALPYAYILGNVCVGMKPPVLHTERLLLRRWTEEDRAVLAAVHSDPEVMRYRFAPLTREQSDAMMDEIETCFDQNGFGLWAVERKSDGRLIGWAGLEVSDIDAPFCPAVDIGWTLSRAAWGNGFATEAAAAALDYAFNELELAEVVAHTTTLNEPSQAVMRRLGMTHDPNDDFDAPWYPVGHPRRRFVLFRIRSSHWRLQRTNQLAR
jgi:ribosomal-protein-alanine N-acetyltransferase